jgi:hypothetical protein
MCFLCVVLFCVIVPVPVVVAATEFALLLLLLLLLVLLSFLSLLLFSVLLLLRGHAIDIMSFHCLLCRRLLQAVASWMLSTRAIQKRRLFSTRTPSSRQSVRVLTMGSTASFTVVSHSPRTSFHLPVVAHSPCACPEHIYPRSCCAAHLCSKLLAFNVISHVHTHTLAYTL